MKLCLKFEKDTLEKYQIDIIKSFILLLQEKLTLTGDLTINFLNERKGKMTTGSFKNKTNEIKVLSKGRMLADVLRTLSHEWAHCYDHQKLKIKDRKEVGGESEDFANKKSGEITKKFIKSHPKLHKKIFN
jgi:hypothetical protein